MMIVTSHRFRVCVERERDSETDIVADRRGRPTFILPLDTRHTNLFVFINRFFSHLPGIMNKVEAGVGAGDGDADAVGDWPRRH